MFNKLEVIASGGAVLTLYLEDYSEGYLIKGIDGLDPVKANIVSSSSAERDGTQHQSSRREGRNIILKLGYMMGMGGPVVRDLRKRLYTYLMPKSKVTLAFYMDGMPTLYAYGRVESFVSPLFVKEPDATISILCDDPDFLTNVPVLIGGSTNAAYTEIPVNYEGDVDTGIFFWMDVNREINNFSISLRNSEGKFSDLAFSLPFESLSAGDRIAISTISGAKGATLTRDNAYRSMLYGISPYSQWITLTPGLNQLSVTAEGAAIPFTVEYQPRFGGL